MLEALSYIVIPHLEMRACDWSKSRQVTYTKLQLCEYSCMSIMPSLITHVSLIFSI